MEALKVLDTDVFRVNGKTFKPEGQFSQQEQTF